MGQCKLVFAFLLLSIPVSSWGQAFDSGQSSPAPAPTPKPNVQSAEERHPASANPVEFVRNIGRDQKVIWTSPFKVKIEDLNWLVPFAGLTAGLINADAELSSRINPNNTFPKHASTISNAGVAIALGGSGGLFLLGKMHGDDHKRETGILAIQA